MAVRALIIFVALFSSLAASCYGEGVSFSHLANTLTVTTNSSGNVNLQAGKDQITVTWALNPSNSNVDTSAYRKVEAKLCFLPVSQKDRPWRKTEEDLARDKTCQFSIIKKDYISSSDSSTYTVKKDVPTAHYFIRVYVFDGPDGKQVAYGQTTGLDLYVTGVSGRSTSIDIAASIFSAFSVLSLAFFFYLEKKKSKRAT